MSILTLLKQLRSGEKIIIVNEQGEPLGVLTPYVAKPQTKETKQSHEPVLTNDEFLDNINQDISKSIDTENDIYEDIFNTSEKEDETESDSEDMFYLEHIDNNQE